MWVDPLDLITNLGIFLLWLLLALSMVSMLVTTIGRVVVNNLLELIGLVPFIVGCRKLSGSDTLILVTLTCVNRGAAVTVNDKKLSLDPASASDSHSVTESWCKICWKKIFATFRAFFKRQQQPLGGSCSVCQSARQLASWRSCKWESLVGGGFLPLLPPRQLSSQR